MLNSSSSSASLSTNWKREEWCENRFWRRYNSGGLKQRSEASSSSSSSSLTSVYLTHKIINRGIEKIISKHQHLDSDFCNRPTVEMFSSVRTRQHGIFLVVLPLILQLFLGFIIIIIFITCARIYLLVNRINQNVTNWFWWNFYQSCIDAHHTADWILVAKGQRSLKVQKACFIFVQNFTLTGVML